MVHEFDEATEDFQEKSKTIEDKEALERYYKFIGERLRNAREQSGYTLAKLANGIGLTSAAVANYESGIRQIPVHVLQEFAKVLGKPLHYFLGPDVEAPALIGTALKTAIERFTDAAFVEVIFEIKEGVFNHPESLFSPLIPVPAEIANDQHFAVRELDNNTGVFRYYICKWYKPKITAKGIPFLWQTRTNKHIPLNPEDWVIAEHGDTQVFELVQFKDVTPSTSYKGKDDPRMVNICAVIIAKLERLVK